MDAFGCQVKAAVYNRAQGQRAIRLRWIVRELAAKRRESLKTFTILIISENEFMRPIHNRMPVILEPKDYERWLDAGDPRQAAGGLAPTVPCRTDGRLAGERPRGECAQQRSCAAGALGLVA